MHLIYLPGRNEGPEPKRIMGEFDLAVQCNTPWEVADDEYGRRLLAAVPNIHQWDPVKEKPMTRRHVPMRFGTQLRLPGGLVGLVTYSGAEIVRVQVEGEESQRRYAEDQVDTIHLSVKGEPLAEPDEPPTKKASKKAKED